MNEQQTNAGTQSTNNSADVTKTLYPTNESDKAQSTTDASTSTTDTQKTDGAKSETSGEAPAPVDSGEKKADGKAKDEKKSDEQIALTLPKDSVLDQAHLDAVTSFAKEKGLTPEVAQEIVNQNSALLKSFAENQQKQFEAQLDSWKKAAETDREIGGVSFKENVHLAKQVARRFGTPEFVEGLDTTGFGNHPELVRFLTRIGKAMSNDTLVRPGSNGMGGKKSLEEVFYGAAKQN